MVLFLAFLFPVSIYCVVLGLINRRRHPLMVPGTWDFVGVLGAVSGFVLAGSGFLWSALSDRWRIFWLFGHRRQLHELEGAGQFWFIALTVCYLLLLGLGAAWVLMRRRHMTVIYNVEPAVFDDVLAQVLEGKGYAWTRAGNRVFISADREEAKLEGLVQEAVPMEGGLSTSIAPVKIPVKRPMRLPEYGAVLDVESSLAMRNVTLHWTLYTDRAEWTVRQEVEGEVARVLTELPMRSNPAGSVLLSLGAILMCVCFFMLVTLLLIASDASKQGL